MTDDSQASCRPLEAAHARRWATRLGIAGVVLALVACRGWILAPSPAGGHSRVEDWFFGVNQSTPQIALAVVAWMVWIRRNDLWEALSGSGPRAGAVMPLGLAAAALIRALWIGHVDLQMDAFVIGSIGSLWWIGGPALVARFGVPVLFLFLSRPWPPLLSNAVLFPMQTATAEAVGTVVDWFGRPAIVSGDLIVYGARVFEVVETCSGLRILVTLVSASLLLGEVLGRRPARRLLLLACAPAVAFTMNLLRVLTLVFSPWAENAIAHSAQGVLMLIVGILVLWGVDGLAERRARRREPTRVADETAPIPPHPLLRASLRRRTWPLVAYWGVLAVVSFVVAAPPQPVARPEPPIGALYRLPVAGWEGHYVEPDRGFLGSVRFDDSFSSRFVRRGPGTADALPVDVWIAISDPRRRDRSPYSDKARLLGAGWSDVGRRSTIELPTGGRFDRSVQKGSGARRDVVYFQRRGAREPLDALVRWWLTVDADPRRLPPTVVTFRLATPDRPDALGPPDQRLGELLSVLVPLVEEHFPQMRAPTTPR